MHHVLGNVRLDIEPRRLPVARGRCRRGRRRPGVFELVERVVVKQVAVLGDYGRRR